MQDKSKDPARSLTEAGEKQEKLRPTPEGTNEHVSLMTVPENQRCPDMVEATKSPGQDEGLIAVTMTTSHSLCAASF